MAEEKWQTVDAPSEGSATQAKSAEKPAKEGIQVEGLDTGGILEAVEDAESAEGVDRLKVSETKEGVGEHRRATGKKFTQFKKQLTDEEAAELKKKLLKKPPTKAQMIREIRAQVHGEIQELEKDAHKYKRKEKFAELVTAVARIRELKLILNELFHATAEKIRNVWLKVVHGIV